MPGKLFGFSSVASLLLLVVAVSGIIGWALDLTGQKMRYGLYGTATYTGLSALYELFLLLAGVVVILWLLSRKKIDR